ncbi:MAG TPA: hypothetical protein IAB20_07840 [Candidatus Pullichristensenella excrementipullorum]|nr:hypothetical protein [Candidatus Pullichristensenella excrementipullorum]
MRTRRFLALLLTLALLMGAACAESGLRPRRDGGPVTEMTPPTGEPLSQQRWTGAFTVDRNGRAQTWQLVISYGEYEDGMLLQASATPESGEGVALRATMQVTVETILAWSSMSADARAEFGSLQVLDAASGEASAEYALCVGPEGLTVLDGADNELLSWSFSQSPFFNVLWYDPDYSALEARFDALSEGEAIFVSLRELVLPLAQGAYRADMGEIKLHLPEETFEAADALLAELKGGVRLTPTGDGLRFAYYSEGSPELSRHRLEGELTDDGGEFTLLTRENAELVTVGHAQLNVRDRLYLYAEDYVRGRFLCLDARPLESDDEEGFRAALSFDAAGDGDVAHIFLDHASSTANAAWETTLRVDAGGDTLTWTLSLAEAA